MTDIQFLIQRIQQCNLSEDDKQRLISILEEQSPDMNQFLLTFFNIIKVGKECLKLFDIDIGES